ncbi:MAG: ribosomal RNA small subunit methyltransferase A [Candidatus Eisenbacteria bacterium]|nr:ribosomal RNA small subunit methyltransferase A [Candidatus Eisenbacteria bacterium]
MAEERRTPAGAARALREAGHRPSKSLGQNFLVDPNLLRKIADAADPTGRERVLEIGSGPGTLTALLAERAARVDSVEIDRRLMEEQQRFLAGVTNVRFHCVDFLDFDPGAAEEGGRLVVVGNIPYHATSPILERLLGWADRIDRAVLCLQRETAERIAAAPGSRAFGRLSLAVRYRAAVEPLFRVGPAAFRPRPRVESAVIRLRFYDPPPFRAKDEDLLFRLARALFGGRRKMIRTGLRRFGSFTPEQIRSVEKKSGVSLASRPEELDVAAWCRLADAVGSTA